VNKGEKTTGEMILLYQQRLGWYYPEHEIRAIVNHLFDNLLGWSRATVHLNRGKVLDKETETRFLTALDRLNRGEPVQYIIGSTEFCGLAIQVHPGILIPRTETEELAMLITRENQQTRGKEISILDMGTGSGCLALAMKQAFPIAVVTGIDKYPDALDTARKNAANNNLDVEFIAGDILDPDLFLAQGPYHIIISNPPYIPLHERSGMKHHVVNYEPGHALFVPDDDPMLFYRAIAEFSIRHLTPDGSVYAEIHENYGTQTTGTFHRQGFRNVQVLRDFFNKNRFIRASSPA